MIHTQYHNTNTSRSREDIDSVVEDYRCFTSQGARGYISNSSSFEAQTQVPNLAQADVFTNTAAISTNHYVPIPQVVNASQSHDKTIPVVEDCGCTPNHNSSIGNSPSFESQTQIQNFVDVTDASLAYSESVPQEGEGEGGKDQGEAEKTDFEVEVRLDSKFE